MTTAADLLAAGPAAAYLFDETSGTTLVDATANGRDGAYAASGVTLGEPGLTADSAAAVSFDGSTGEAVVSGVGSWLTSSSALSVAITATAPAFAALPCFVYIEGLLYLYVQSSGVPEVALNTSAGGSELATSTVAISPGETVRLVATCDGTTLRLYQEGALVASTTLAGTPDAVGAAVHFGSDDFGFYACTVDEAGLFASVLTDADVASIHPPPPAPIPPKAGFGLVLDSSAVVNVTPLLDAITSTVPLHVIAPTVPVPTLVNGRPS